MNDLRTLWVNKTGEEPTGVVTIEYELSIEADGCCELCFSEEPAVNFYLVDGSNTRIGVADYLLGIYRSY